MHPRARGRGLLARGLGVSGRTGIFCYHDRNATLRRSAPATWTLPRIAHRSNSISSKITPGIRREPPVRLSRRLQHTNVKPPAYRSSSVLGSAFRNASAALAGKIDDIGAALSPAKVDVIVVRKRTFEVPRGRRVSERMWAEFNSNGNRKVSFSPIVEAKLVPSKEECYPTARYKAACFFSKYHKDVETRRISRGGPDQAEWLVLLSETRQAAAEGRKKQREEEQRELRTEQGAPTPDSSRLDLRDEKKSTQPDGEEQGVGSDGRAAGSSDAEAARVASETGSSGWRRFSIFPAIGGKDKKRGLSKAAKTFGGWVERFYRVSWTPRHGGADSRFDWVVDFSAGPQQDVV